jgi:anti-sigma regulatory factor (Ser/Thr protein kinase)
VSAEANPPPSSTSFDADPVELSVPLRAQYGSTIRTVAASLGADAGFSVDELDDIRLALSEVFSALAEAAEDDPHARALVSFTVASRSVSIEVASSNDSTSIEFDELALGILRSVTDEFEVTPTGAVFTKHATEAHADPAVS